uniref:Tight junction associated protein 1 (peripheral) n=1 Tax=Petromyzon marinus TaxID=7757 RepID=S4R4K8_PETMA
MNSGGVVARKPYRKAPPEHRESRPPGARHLAEPAMTRYSHKSRVSPDTAAVSRDGPGGERTGPRREADRRATQRGLEAELGQAWEEIRRLQDMYGRMQSSYLSSQKTNQDLEEKLQKLASLCYKWYNAAQAFEKEKTSLNVEIVALTGKLMDSKTTINKLEEENERFRKDCNLAVHLLQCNKSHFRNHKYSELPQELQELVSKHMGGEVGDAARAPPFHGPPSAHPNDSVPTSVIVRVLEKPEPLGLQSASSRSAPRPLAGDTFVHVDMSAEDYEQDDRQSSVDGAGAPRDNGCERSASSPRRLSPYPTPALAGAHATPPSLPPSSTYGGRRALVEFSGDDHVRIPKNSPLPNCTYATRQAISLSMAIKGDAAAVGKAVPPPTPPGSHAEPAHQCGAGSDALGAKWRGAPGETEMLGSWRRMFVDKVAPDSDKEISSRTSFDSESVQLLSEVLGHASQDSGPDTDRVERKAEERCVGERSTEREKSAWLRDESAVLGASDKPEETVRSVEEVLGGQDHLLSNELGDLPPPRAHKTHKRMGVHHHLRRKNSFTKAQEDGSILD